jgi:hypothetical protein
LGKTIRHREGASDTLVFFVRGEATCSACGTGIANGGFITKERGRTLCLGCGGLDGLSYLPKGDAILTRRASKHSSELALVVTRVYSRKRYKREGILVEPAAIERARKECRADAAARDKRREEREREHAGRFARALRRRYPSCPKGIERKIARHACETSSGRVGRTSGAKRLDEKAVRLAVLAHVRHHYTKYDKLIDEGMTKMAARTHVQDKVDDVLRRWSRKARPMK